MRKKKEKRKDFQVSLPQTIPSTTSLHGTDMQCRNQNCVWARQRQRLIISPIPASKRNVCSRSEFPHFPLLHHSLHFRPLVKISARKFIAVAIKEQCARILRGSFLCMYSDYEMMWTQIFLFRMGCIRSKTMLLCLRHHGLRDRCSPRGNKRTAD